VAALRAVKSVLVLTVGLWALLVAYDNVADYDANWNFVVHVLRMDTVFPDNPLKSRAVASTILDRAAYWAIIATEFAAGLLCVLGAVRLFRARRDRAAFVAAKTTAAGGLLLVWLLYFVGFITVGGEWFSMWQSPTWNGQQGAFRFLVGAMLVMIVVLLPEEDA